VGGSNVLRLPCGGGIEREGKTLHCLMDVARRERKQGNTLKFNSRLSDACQREVSTAIFAFISI